MLGWENVKIDKQYTSIIISENMFFGSGIMVCQLKPLIVVVVFQIGAIILVPDTLLLIQLLALEKTAEKGPRTWAAC